MSQGYSVTLTRCMLISAIGLLSGVAFSLPPYLPLLFGLAPLIWYHLGYLRRHAGEGISQPAVDSVYYFGFLITIGALGATALRLGIYGVEGSFAAVAMQFGLGLLATGYAVWARIHLTASSKLLDEANLEEAMNRYVERSRELVSNVEMASSSFKAYADTVLTNTEAFAQRVHADTTTEIKSAAQLFRDSILGLSEEGKLALQSLRAVVNDVTFGSEREELRRSVSAMTTTVTALTSSLEELKASSQAGASIVGDFAGGLAAVSKGATDAAQGLGELGDRNGILPKVINALQDSRTQFEQLNLSVDVAGASATKFSDSITGTTSAADAFGANSKQAVQSMHKVAATLEKIASFAASIENLEGRLQTLGNVSDKSDASLTGMVGKIDELKEVLENLNAALTDSTGGLKDAMSSISDELESRLRRSIETVEAHVERVNVVMPSSPIQGTA